MRFPHEILSAAIFRGEFNPSIGSIASLRRKIVRTYTCFIFMQRAYEQAGSDIPASFIRGGPVGGRRKPAGWSDVARNRWMRSSFRVLVDAPRARRARVYSRTRTANSEPDAWEKILVVSLCSVTGLGSASPKASESVAPAGR